MKELHAVRGSCNVQIRFGTWQSLIICIPHPNTFQIPYVYFYHLRCYFHCLHVILHLPPFQSKSSITSALHFDTSDIITSPFVSFYSTVPPASAFLEYCLYTLNVLIFELPATVKRISSA